MSMSNDLNSSSLRWYYMILFSLDILNKNSDDAQNKIKDIEINRIQNAANNLKINREVLIILDKIRCSKTINKKDYKLIDLILEESNTKSNKIKVIKKSDNFNSVLDNDFLNGIVSDEDKVINSLNKGFDFLNRISPKWFENSKVVLNTVCGVHDKRNLINSGFTKDFPGFINFNINCDAEIIGEQIAHETTHLIFDNLMFFKKNIRDFIKSLPPVYSIFAKKPRSAELVIHGLFSYTSVYHYWDGIEKNKLSNLKTVRKRKSQVRKYIDKAIIDLDNVLTNSQWNKLNNIYKKICPLHNDSLWVVSASIKKYKSNNKICNIAKEYLNEIETAELLLAIEGNKVSRISKNINEIDNLVDFLNKLPIHYCFSNYLFESMNDENLNSFKNVITSIYQLDNFKNENLDIHIYLSNKKSLLKKAFLLDQSDDCGTLFGTPKCCQTFFKNNWEKAIKKYNGDLARLPYSSGSFKIENDMIYTPFAMYFGGGVCWHFPCKTNCSATKKLVDKRIKLLSKYPTIFKKLISLVPEKLNFNPKKGYSIIE